jgi:cysteine desulfurase
MDAPALVTSRLEHPSVTRAAEALTASGIAVRWLAVTPQGQVDISHLEALLGELPKGARVAVQAVNHETGVVQPLAAIAEVTARAGATLHVDAVQAIGKLDPSVWLHGDSYAVAAHKLRGPKGVGAFVWRCGRPVPRPLLHGGSQQRGFRPGTLDPISVIGFGAAWERLGDGPARNRALAPLRDRLEHAMGPRLQPNVSLAAAGPQRLGHVASLYSPDFTGEELVAALDLEGICLSSGSACSAGTAEPSPAILAMHGASRAAHTIRLSLGETTTEDEIDRTLRALDLVLRRL